MDRLAESTPRDLRPSTPEAQRPILERWKGVGTRLKQQRQEALERLGSVSVPENISSLDRKALSGLTPEQKLKAVLTALDLDLERGGFQKGVNYRFLLFDLAMLPDSERNRMLKDTGLGDMLCFQAVETLKLIGEKKVSLPDGIFSKEKIMNDYFSALPLGRQFAKDSELTQVYDSAALLSVVDQNLHLSQRKAAVSGEQVSQSEQWAYDRFMDFAGRFLARTAIHNPHVKKDLIVGFFERDLVPSREIVSSLLDYGRHGRWGTFMLGDEKDYLAGYNVVSGLECNDLSDLSRIAEFNTDASCIIGVFDRELSQAETEKERWHIFGEYCHLFQTGAICPPIKQRFDFVDSLFLHEILDPTKEKIRIKRTGDYDRDKIVSSIWTLDWTWERFMGQFLSREDLARTEFVLDRSRYEAAKKRHVRREIAAEKMDAALQQDRRRDEIEAEIIVRSNLLGGDIPQIGGIVQAAEEAMAVAGPASSFRGSYENHKAISDYWRSDGGADLKLRGNSLVASELVSTANLKDKPQGDFWGIAEVVGGELPGDWPYPRVQAEVEKIVGILKQLEASGISAPFEAMYWLVDGGAAFFRCQQYNPYVDREYLNNILLGYTDQVAGFLEQVIAVDSSMEEKLSGAGDYFEKLRMAIPQIELRYSRKSPFEYVEDYKDQLKQMGVPVGESYSTFGKFFLPEYFRRKVIRGEGVKIEQGIPVDFFASRMLVDGYRLVEILHSDSHTIVPFDFEMVKGGIMMVLGPNNAGKSTLAQMIADNLGRAEMPKLPLCMSMERPGNEHGEAISRGVTAPETTLTESLFSSNCQNLAQTIMSVLRGENLPPVVLRLDEWGIGTDDIARVSILWSAILHLKQLKPDLSFVLITHEGEELFILHKSLGLREENQAVLPHMETVVLNPLTRQGRKDALGGSLARIAVEEVDPEVAQAAQMIHELRRAGIADFDLSSIEAFEAVEPPSSAFTSSLDLERMGIKPGNLQEGDFAAFLQCLDKLEVGTAEDRIAMASYFGDIFVQLATAADASKMPSYREAVARFRDVPEGIFKNTVLAKTLSAVRTSQLLFSKELKPEAINEYVDLFKDPQSLKRNLQAVTPLLKHLKMTEDEMQAVSQSITSLSEQAPQLLENLAQEVRRASQKFFISASVDMVNLRSEVAQLQSLDAISTRLSQLAENYAEVVEGLKSAEKLDDFMLQLLEEGKFDGYAAIVNLFPSDDLNKEETAKFIGLDRKKEEPITAEQIARSSFLARLDRLKGRPIDVNLLRTMQASVTEYPDYARFLGEIQVGNILPAETQEVYGVIEDSLRRLVYGVGGAVFTSDANALGIRWSKPEISDSPDEFPVSFKNAVDPAVKHALLGQREYIPLELNLAEGDSPKHNLVKLSGPNFEGKTSHMIATLKMSLYNFMLGFVPAESATLVPTDYVAISVNAFVPDPEAGVGSLLAQALDARRIVDKARLLSRQGKRGLIAGDELWLGTESSGRTDLQAITWYQLLSLENVFGICATHDSNLDGVMDGINRGSGKVIDYTNVAIEEHRPRYGDRGESQPYKILEVVLRQKGVPDVLVKSLIDNAQSFEALLRGYHRLAEAA